VISIEASISKGWLSRALGVRFDRDYYLDPRRRREIDRRCGEYARRELADLQIACTESNLGRRRWIDPDQVLVGGIQPNLILGLLLGAELVAHPEMDADVTPRCLAGRDPAELPDPEELLAHPLMERFDGQIQALLRDRSAGLRPIPPFFWDTSGRAAVHGALTTAQKLAGEGIFADLLLDPEPCRRLLAWIAEAWIALVRHYSRLAETAVDCVHVGECSACLVSAEHFEEFVSPTLARISQALGPLRLHSCGSSDHLLEPISRLERLQSVDLGGETSVARARAALGRDLPISIAPLTSDLSSDSPTGILAWARRALEGNGGGDLTILYHLEPGHRLEVVRALHAFVAGHAVGG